MNYESKKFRYEGFFAICEALKNSKLRSEAATELFCMEKWS